MDDLRERLEQLAKWHEWEMRCLLGAEQFHHQTAATTLREALAHPERLMGEPVAWRYRYSGLEEWKYVEREALCNPHDCYERTKLYAPKEVKP